MRIENFMTMDDAKADELAPTGDGAGRAANGTVKEALRKVLPTVLVVRFLQLDNQVQILLAIWAVSLIDLQIASNLAIIEQAPAKQ
jgi:hypothetical protein